MSRRQREATHILANALHMEKQVSQELAKALQAQMVINEHLMEMIAALQPEES